MCLTEMEIKRYYKLWCTLVWGINEKQNIIPKFKKPVYGTKTMSIKPFMELKDKIFDNPQWIDEFIKDGAYGELNKRELEMAQEWRKHFVKGKFVVIDHIEDKYSVFMPLKDATALYGVYGISDPLNILMMPLPKPTVIEAVLLPFNDKIILNSLFEASTEPMEQRFINAVAEVHNHIMRTNGIIENLNKPPVISEEMYECVPIGTGKRNKLSNQFAEIDMTKMPPGMKLENICEEYTRKPYVEFLKGYDNSLYDKIMGNICDWLDDFEDSREFRALSSRAKRAADFIVQTFAQYMYTFRRQEPSNWNADALTEILSILFPRKVSAENELFYHVEPVLYGYFVFLQKHISNVDELTKALPAVCNSMIINAKNSENWAPAKQAAMMTIESMNLYGEEIGEDL